MTVTLDWGGLPCAAAYEAQVGTSCETGPTYATTASSRSVSGLQPLTTYYWRVRAQNGDGLWGPWSNCWSFTTELGGTGEGLVRTAMVDTYTQRDYDDLCGTTYFLDGDPSFDVSTREDITRTARALLLFNVSDITSLPPIQGATLRLYAQYETEYVTNQFHTSRILENWDTTRMNWCQRLQSAPWCTAGVCFTSAGEDSIAIPSKFNGGNGGYDEYVDFDVTAIVQAWQQGAPNDGICVWQTPLGGHGRNQAIVFTSKEGVQGSERGPRLLLNPNELVSAPSVGTALTVPGVLTPPHPNPSSGITELRYLLSERSQVVAAVFDVSGRRVGLLQSGTVEPGEHTLRWTGRDTSGAPWPAGVYFIRLTTSSGTDTKKVVLMR